ncbi:uncharacterized protein LOC114323420 [Camellia sinensis]|uniref:uncharacterized protein LOC114323420 n=1 Tax=Camellia sinensis TaxID=4442 RepID=UPI0010366404|nr:uncharacterized protein LOC114323420 [Camellia sinensis]
MDFMAVGSEGSAGGLLCIWDPQVFHLVDCCSNRRFILLSGLLFNSFDCVIVNLYAPNEVGDRRKFWEGLSKLKNDFPKPWCLCGDFNQTRFVSERKGYNRKDSGMSDLNEFIDKCEVNDLPLLGRKFTWCNSADGQRWSRIDRVLVDPNWLEVFKFKLWGLPRLISDHCPLLVMEDDRDWGPKPFRFVNAWCLHPFCAPLVDKSWKEAVVHGWAGYILLQKLKALKQILRIWNKEIYGNVSFKLKAAEEEKHNLDLQAETRDLTQAEIIRRRVVREEVWRLNRMVEWMWLQNSRLSWTLKGDRNTRFFHVMARSRQSRNVLTSITVGDSVVEDPYM